jgi:hypothetical protein
MKPKFSPGKNIAIKVPEHEYDQTVAFYRDVLGFEPAGASMLNTDESAMFRFGEMMLWIDKSTGISQAEIWLEVVASDIASASDYLKDNNCIRCDQIEPLPEGFKGFWISSPANIIHLVAEEAAG